MLPSQQTLTPHQGSRIRGPLGPGFGRTDPPGRTGRGDPRGGAWPGGGRTCHRTGRGSAACRGGARHRPHPPRRPRHRCRTALAGRPRPPQRPGRLAHANHHPGPGRTPARAARTGSRVGGAPPSAPLPRGPRQRLPHSQPGPTVPSPQPRRAAGGAGLSPGPRAARQASRVLSRQGYPPAAPDANEHMAVLSRNPARLGAGTGLGSARAAAAELSRPGSLGTSASARQGRNSRGLTAAQKRQNARARAWERFRPRGRGRWSRELGGRGGSLFSASSSAKVHVSRADSAMNLVLSVADFDVTFVSPSRRGRSHREAFARAPEPRSAETRYRGFTVGTAPSVRL